MHKRLPQQGEVNPKKAQSGSSQSTTRRLSPDSRNYGFAVAGARTLGFLMTPVEFATKWQEENAVLLSQEVDQ